MGEPLGARRAALVERMRGWGRRRVTSIIWFGFIQPRGLAARAVLPAALAGPSPLSVAPGLPAHGAECSAAASLGAGAEERHVGSCGLAADSRIF